MSRLTLSISQSRRLIPEPVVKLDQLIYLGQYLACGMAKVMYWPGFTIFAFFISIQYCSVAHWNAWFVTPALQAAKVFSPPYHVI